MTDKGFGFISREGEEKDLFFHSNEFEGVSYDALNEGDEVEFEVIEGHIFEILDNNVPYNKKNSPYFISSFDYKDKTQIFKYNN